MGRKGLFTVVATVASLAATHGFASPQHTSLIQIGLRRSQDVNSGRREWVKAEGRRVAAVARDQQPEWWPSQNYGAGDRFAASSSGQHRMLRVSTVLRDTSGEMKETMVEIEKTCVVTCFEAEPIMSISLEIAGKDLSIDRMQEDEVEGALQRLERLLREEARCGVRSTTGLQKKKKVKGKGKRRQAAAEAAAVEHEAGSKHGEGIAEEVPICVELFDKKRLPVSSEALNKAAWEQGGTLVVTKGKEKFVYNIMINIPSVSYLSVDTPPMVGYMLQPRWHCDFAEPELIKWRWLRRAEKESFERLECVHEGETYTPTSDDVGGALVVECTPARSLGGDQELLAGEKKVFELHRAVKLGPDISIHLPRFSYASEHRPSCESMFLRLVSYNVLADNYANTPFAREKLYGYCPDEFLELGYRKQLILSEIIAYKATVVCLQEISRDLYCAYLMPALAKYGYDGVYANKLGVSNIGCAIFWDASQYLVAESHVVDLAYGWREHRDLAKMCSGSDPSRVDMTAALERSTTIAQVVMLQEVGLGGKKVCVVNTHLFGHPDATHVRLVQSAVLARRVEILLAREFWSQAAVLVCGDFNSSPAEGVCDFFENGGVGMEHSDWWKGLSFKHVGSREERESRWFEGRSTADEREGALVHACLKVFAGRDYFNYRSRPCLDLPSLLILKRACKHVEATICMSHGPQIVDHIFFSASNLCEASDAFPAMPVRAITMNSGIPSEVFPSDHVALIADLCWRDSD